MSSRLPGADPRQAHSVFPEGLAKPEYRDNNSTRPWCNLEPFKEPILLMLGLVFLLIFCSPAPDGSSLQVGSTSVDSSACSGILDSALRSSGCPDDSPLPLDSPWKLVADEIETLETSESLPFVVSRQSDFPPLAPQDRLESPAPVGVILRVEPRSPRLRC